MSSAEALRQQLPELHAAPMRAAERQLQYPSSRGLSPFPSNKGQSTKLEDLPQSLRSHADTTPDANRKRPLDGLWGFEAGDKLRNAKSFEFLRPWSPSPGPSPPVTGSTYRSENVLTEPFRIGNLARFSNGPSDIDTGNTSMMSATSMPTDPTHSQTPDPLPPKMPSTPRLDQSYEQDFGSMGETVSGLRRPDDATLQRLLAGPRAARGKTLMPSVQSQFEPQRPQRRVPSDGVTSVSSWSHETVDVNIQCGVSLRNGDLCPRSLTCESHSMETKRHVPGRILPLDALLANYPKRSQVRQQLASHNAETPSPWATLPPVDYDKPTDISSETSSTVRFSEKPWLYTPSLLDPNSYAFTAFQEHPLGYYTPTLGGSPTLPGGEFGNKGYQASLPVHENPAPDAIVQLPPSDTPKLHSRGCTRIRYTISQDLTDHHAAARARLCALEGRKSNLKLQKARQRGLFKLHTYDDVVPEQPSITVQRKSYSLKPLPHDVLLANYKRK
ncbi:uncharacterized protein HMPREF1541_02998 [Cyphellophora europaea CBS 101466]|uniref:SCA7 domain-containing protein n=1 Tax=Cyphellophora europaea (strain CBS 101466) TaxID=1220924 RepID=W2RZ63_CYPE1|nr:uncharacterized protein HMPREF1541_02998 [Cyphellophora europaea CBS 101466]ETN41063.1 hypothetical protein HMPREF1541_02998 [Cyphellophora europaea CBS 101466]